MTDAQFQEWLQSPSAIRMVLIEAQVNVGGDGRCGGPGRATW